MEQIIINSIEKVEKMGKTPYWKVKDSMGKVHTVWDEELAQVLFDTKGQPMNVELKLSGNFSNIRGATPVNMDMGQPAPQPVAIPTAQQEAARKIMPQQAIPLTRDKPLLDFKQTSIIAQCLTKCCWYGRSDATPDDVMGTYNHFLKEL